MVTLKDKAVGSKPSPTRPVTLGAYRVRTWELLVIYLHHKGSDFISRSIVVPN
jgi:hypothetical protein